MSQKYVGYDSQEFTNWLQPFFKDADIYRSPDGKLILKCEYFAEDLKTGEELSLPNNFFFSEDGISFYQLNSTGMSGSHKKSKHTLQDVRKGKNLTLLLTKEFVTLIHTDRESKVSEIWNDHFEHYSLDRRAKLAENAVFIPLPEVRVCEYLLHFPDGRYIYVNRTKYNFRYEDVRLFIGRLDAMQEVPIDLFERYRDGGTTIIETNVGNLFVPTSLNEEKKPTWTPIENGFQMPEEVLTRIEASDYRDYVIRDLMKIVIK